MMIKFNKADVENCRKEAPERIKSIKKFNEYIDRTSGVSQKSMERYFI